MINQENINTIFVDDDYIAMFVQKGTAKEHSHGWYHLFLNFENEGKVAVCKWVAPKQPHIFQESGQWRLVLLINPICDFIHFLKSRDKEFYIEESEQLFRLMMEVVVEKTTFSMERFMNELLLKINYHDLKRKHYNDYIMETVAILHNQSGDISVSDLCHQVGVSKSYLSHMFREQTGITINNYMLLLKWKKSFTELLAKRNVTIAAMEGGFCSSAHFSTVNRKLTGIQAKEYTKYCTMAKK